MKKSVKIISASVIIIAVLIFLLPYLINANPKDIDLTIHLRGVYKSKINVIPLMGDKNPIAVINELKENNKATISISSMHLPGEFLLHLEYYETESSSRALSAEAMIILYKQDVEMWIHPLHINNLDSTYFHKKEKENTEFISFMKKNNKNNEMLDLLQNFLFSYDDKDSDFYQSAVKELNKRRTEHNQWIDEKIEKNKGLFASSLFSLYYVPEITWTGSQTELKQSYINNYFSHIDFNDTLLLKSSSFKPWMDNYVNLHVELVKNPETTDSLFTMAGFNAIEKAKHGHPLVYGWVVDYFFNGYESLNIQKGIAMLAPYIADPNCMTQKRQEIERRLKGITTLVPGVPAPNFDFEQDGNKFNFREFKTNAPYKLVLFWSAGCPHCVEMAKRVHKWYQQNNNQNKLEIFAISLDEDDVDISEWKKLKSNMQGWHHILAEGGVNSPQANSYFILSTPTLFIVETKNNTITALPNNIREIEEAIK